MKEQLIGRLMRRRGYTCLNFNIDNEHSAMISCNDGFRPVSFLLEAI